jgi:hypothetical protein
LTFIYAILPGMVGLEMMATCDVWLERPDGTRESVPGAVINADRVEVRLPSGGFTRIIAKHGDNDIAWWDVPSHAHVGDSVIYDFSWV